MRTFDELTLHDEICELIAEEIGQMEVCIGCRVSSHMDCLEDGEDSSESMIKYLDRFGDRLAGIRGRPDRPLSILDELTNPEARLEAEADRILFAA